MYFTQITTPGLGCFSYILGCPAAGTAVVVDPKRDVGTYLDISRQHGMAITHIIETHVHADHVSGAHELQAATGADIYIHASAPVTYLAKKVHEGDEFTLGTVHIQVVHTPGHTPNSISLLVTDTGRSPHPCMILTGDLLFIGDVGRPDLPGHEVMGQQVDDLYHSLYITLGALPDSLEVYPAHGQGSLCGRGMSAKGNSTLGYERVANPMLQFKEFESFKKNILSNMPMRPQSFSHIIASNLAGAPLLPCGATVEPALSLAEVETLRTQGAAIIDTRDTAAFGGFHIPGSLNIDATEPQLVNWLGTVLGADVPIILVLHADTDFAAIKNSLDRIGYGANVRGYLRGGMKTWAASGKYIATLPHISAHELKNRLKSAAPLTIVDVRTPAEREQRHIEGSVFLPFDALLKGPACPTVPDGDIVVLCHTGYRANIAASILQSRGCANIMVLAGGITAW